MPSSIEKLQKFLRLEAERGYDNRAVVGGLDKIVPNWVSEAREQNLDAELIQRVTQDLNSYGDMDPQSRPPVVQSLLDYLQEQLTANPSLASPAPAEKNTSATRGQDPQSPKGQRERDKGSKGGSGTRSQPSRQAEDVSHLGLNAPLTVLTGIGHQNAQTLQNLGLETLGDLLYYFPRRYIDYSQLKTINRIEYGEELTIIAGVQSVSTRPIRGGQMQIIEVIVSDSTGFLRLSWFNQNWIANRLKPGEQIIISGKVDMYLGRLVMNNPEWETLDQQQLNTNRIVSVYSLTARVTQRMLRRIIHQTVSFWAPRLVDPLPEKVKQSAGLVNLATAIQQVHFPDSFEKLQAARARLAFDEIFMLQLGVLRQRAQWMVGTAQQFNASDEWLEQQVSRLPFRLTSAQHKVIDDIRKDLASGKPMNRLLQGDVGSGKTIVAALAAILVAQGGAQTAFMAPTSILAEQHYRNLLHLMATSADENAPLKPEEIRLLIGDTSESEKQEIRESLKSGVIKILVGTHALIEDPVEFERLQFAIVDEQHRFGVSQRSALRAKGENPHLLVMTATPIPRSLALTVYGDLDLSVMDEMPVGRQPIATYVLHPRERERAYQMIHAQIEKGHQAFIIYPLVEKGDRDEAKAAVEEQARLQKEVFPLLKIGLLHGRLKPEEKDRVMTAFRDQEYQVLVSTSVVEVGVDVPNATVMIVEGANRFGLSQLHQFRGRVGRGQDQSYCLLIPETEDAVENERLTVMSETNNGFVLAERDLEQRGPGEFLGTRQSGFNELKMASLTDVHLIEKARQ
ncbi:MAG: ATP-dependent DNA helicase RecG, partial [Anaerolineaceae bacterium]|nr:ATP-dependent DNA helicase RecG [Anaerolineaceae bacterium]